MSSQGHSKRPRKEVRLGKNPDVVYCEEDRIGQGQFGTVYRGRSVATDTFVAVKLLRDIPSATTSENASHLRPDHDTSSAAPADTAATTSTTTTTAPAKPRAKTPLEVNLLWALRADNCPNIVRFLSVWNKPRKHHPPSAAAGTVANPPSPLSPSVPESARRQANVYVLVTEYCEGGDLQHRLQALDSHVPTRVARSFTYQLCNALHTLKRRRIVHRDIKPANLLLSSHDWETATLKVADFGMAKAAPPPKAAPPGGVAARGKEDDLLLHDGDDESAAAPSNLFYSEMGTPMYMSPERIAGQPYDYRADVYSAGMVLLEMMQGTCVRVTRVSQLRTAVPETIQRLRSRYAAKGEAVPLWLDLVQRMTATDPAARLSVEDVLRHPWFAPGVEPALPALTFALPPDAATATVPKDSAADLEKKADTQTAEAPIPSVSASENTAPETASAAEAVGPALTHQAAATERAPEKQGVHETKEPLKQQQHQKEPSPLLPPAATSSEGNGEAVRDITPLRAEEGKRRQEPPSHWMLLGVCPAIDTQHNAARCLYTGPPTKPRHRGAGSAPHIITTATNFASTSFSSSSSSATTTTFALPPACGPHVITCAVRGFVDAVYLYVLQDELDPVAGLTLVSFLVELVQNGFGAYLECLESLGSTSTSAATTTTTAAESASDNVVVLGGHRLLVRDFSVLRDVWQTLMRRLAHTQAAYTAQLPARMLHHAALWRQRVLRSGEVDNGAARDGEDPGAARAEEDDFGAAYDASTTSSEGEVAMPGLPNVASITNVAAAAGAAAAASSPTATAGASLRIYTSVTRAEQLIFAKALDCIQSDALSTLLAEPAATFRRVATVADPSDLLDTTDCLEEEEEAAAAAAMRRREGGTGKVSSDAALPSAQQADPPTTTTAAALPPHRGIALLRVLLQRAVLSAADVGLELEAVAAATRSPPLRPSASPTTRRSGPSSHAAASTSVIAAASGRTSSPEFSATVSASEVAAMRHIFVVQVPVFAMLQAADMKVVENLLSAATRVFASSSR